MQSQEDLSQGMLYLCATPIGNLEDITLRVLRTLEKADIIYCEDTRNSLKLLRHYEIAKPLQSFHDHSPKAKLQRIAEDVQKGLAVAVISDAGMPVISDPGYELVNYFQKEHLPYTVLPGPSASLTALVLSGLESDRFSFEGFLPRQKKALEARLKALDQAPQTTILYESPHRLLALLEAFSTRWPSREVACVREISKRFEEVVRDEAIAVYNHFAEEAPRGEFVVLLGPAQAKAENAEALFEKALAYARACQEEGASTNAAAKEAAAKFGFGKRSIYQKLLADD